MAFTYFKMADFIVDFLFGKTSATKMNQSIRYIAEDVLGDPSANANKPNFSGITATAATAVAAQMSATDAQTIATTMGATGANTVAASRTRATGTSVGAGGVAISSSSSTYASGTDTGSFVDVTNLSVTITTSGRPVRIGLMPVTGGALNRTDGAIEAVNITSRPYIEAHFRILRGVTSVSESTLAQILTDGDSGQTVGVPASAIQFIDDVAAGTYTYKFQCRPTDASNIQVYHVKMFAYEL